MADERTILADSINHLPHLTAWDSMWAKRLSEIQLDKLLIYVINRVDVSALPYLAKQFDVEGIKGMYLAKTEAEQRQIIAKAIELHRYKGTLWAVKEALKSIGYQDAVITEHVEGNWAKFSISIELAGKTLDVSQIDDLINMINEYKPVRSHLVAPTYTIAFDDLVLVNDDKFELLPGEIYDDNVFVGAGRYCDGTYIADGSIDASKDSDILIINTINV